MNLAYDDLLQAIPNVSIASPNLTNNTLLKLRVILFDPLPKVFRSVGNLMRKECDDGASSTYMAGLSATYIA